MLVSGRMRMLATPLPDREVVAIVLISNAAATRVCAVAFSLALAAWLAGLPSAHSPDMACRRRSGRLAEAAISRL